MLRSHGAGTIRSSDVGTTVTLAGWVSRRRDHGGVAFIDLRDASGSVQVVIRDEKLAGALRAEWCLKIVGEVVARPEALPSGRATTSPTIFRHHSARRAPANFSSRITLSLIHI